MTNNRTAVVYARDRFAFLMETNTGSATPRNRNDQRNERVPCQNEKGGLTERPPNNSLSGLHEQLLRIPETSGSLGSEMTVPPYLTFPDVRLRLVRSPKSERVRNRKNSLFEGYLNFH